jgi:hypothetical protein
VSVLNVLPVTMTFVEPQMQLLKYSAAGLPDFWLRAPSKSSAGPQPP